VNTHQGFISLYIHMPFGIASAPVVLQRTMDTILQGISNVVCYQDDYIVPETDRDAYL